MEINEKIRKDVLEFLKNHKVAVIATTSKESEPQVSTVYFVIDDDFTFYFITTSQSRKFKNIKETGRVAIVVGTGPEVITVQCGGMAEIVDFDKNPKEANEAQEIIKKLTAHVDLNKSRQWPILTLPKTGFGIFKVKPQWLVWLNLDLEGRPETYKEDFYKII